MCPGNVEETLLFCAQIRHSAQSPSGPPGNVTAAPDIVKRRRLARQRVYGVM
jgi:hypothetical protein